ncbi:MAG: response regulator [Phycisphaerae bacterium]|nr:response regulator [Phycisphaerae bacterium]
MEKARILLVDDELSPKKDGPNGSYMWYYTQALREAGFEVVEAVGPDFALQRLTSKRLKFDLVIIDIMLPPGKAFGGEDTLNGLRTGVSLARKVQEDYPDLPILVLTNVLNPNTQRQLEQMPSVRKVLAKATCTPFQLVDEIREI